MRFLLAFLKGNASKLVSFFSMDFLFLFLPVVVLGYAVTPRKWKRYFLLAASLLFSFAVSGGMAGYLLLTVVSSYFFGRWQEHVLALQQKELAETEKTKKKAVKKKYLIKQKRILILAALLQIGGLLVLKYSGFFAKNINALFDALSMDCSLPVPHFLVPVGISFFTLQAVSYLLDVYHGVIPAEKNIFRLALFLTFFLQIVEGPICRYEQTAGQLWNVAGITYENLTRGIWRILYGMMKKVVIADRLNPAVGAVFSRPEEFHGSVIAMAAVLYTVQLYCDFSGAMDAVVGIGQIFGVAMPENFSRPFFSRSVSEFWKRWHITLGAWFRDYVFYPVTMSKPMKKLTTAARKRLGNFFGPLPAGAAALFCVWFCNGLWHGADWTYLFFGMYHFVLIFTESLILPAARRVRGALRIREEMPLYQCFQIIRTAILVVIGELFFRAESLSSGFYMFGKIFTDRWTTPFGDETLAALGIDVLDLGIVAVAVLIVFVISLLQEKGARIREGLAGKTVVLRWALLYALILFIVIFGAYGFGYVPVDPMYADF